MVYCNLRINAIREAVDERLDDLDLVVEALPQLVGTISYLLMDYAS